MGSGREGQHCAHTERAGGPATLLHSGKPLFSLWGWWRVSPSSSRSRQQAHKLRWTRPREGWGRRVAGGVRDPKASLWVTLGSSAWEEVWPPTESQGQKEFSMDVSAGPQERVTSETGASPLVGHVRVPPGSPSTADCVAKAEANLLEQLMVAGGYPSRADAYFCSPGARCGHRHQVGR